MEPSQPSPVGSVGPGPSMDAIESLRQIYQQVNPFGHIDVLMSFVENQLHKMKIPSEAGSSSVEGWLETVRESTKLAEKTIDTISIEAEKLSKLDAVEEMRSITLKVVEGVEESHWVFIALSVAAFAVERYINIRSENECKELLMKMLELAKHVKRYSEEMPDERGKRGKLCSAVCTIVEGVVFCYDYVANFLRFWSTTTAAAQFEKTNQKVRDVNGSLELLDLEQYWDKDVFLSHTGKQKNFVRQLHRDLTMIHVSCFFDEDDNSLPLAEKFPSIILKAAETCKLAVVVLSKEFILRKWPMIELSAFIRAKKSGKNANLKILPIFFMITPKEISDITKDSPEWKTFVESDWQAALSEVRATSGLCFRENENEVEFRDKVVDKIRCLLEPIKPPHPQLLEFKPVGIEKQVEHLKALLDMGGAPSDLAVIVCGFGGMGKTTLAASAIQSLDWSSKNFKFCMVAIDEKTPDKTSHIIQIQKYIIKQFGGGELDFQNPLQGRLQIKEALKKKCCLLFIDNVVDNTYVRDLLPQDLQSSEQETKLRIIITARDKNVKAELNIKCEEYEVKGLSHAASKSLLLEIILESQVVSDIDLDEVGMINEVAAACKGVPLLLSIFGKHLRIERGKNSCEEALKILQEGDLENYRDEDLGTRLMFVYDKIKDVEVKEAFLDICIYFHGWEWNLVADIVESPKLDDLHRRMLVYKSGSRVFVHDILRLMGKKRARFTRFLNYEELSRVLEDNLVDFDKVKGISLVDDSGLITIETSQLEAMHKSLRVLRLGDWVTLDGPPCHRAFRNLRYLSVGDITAFPFKDPSKLDKLRVFLNRSKPGMNLSHLPSSLKRVSYEVLDMECNEFAQLFLQNLSSLKSFIDTPKSVKELHLPPSLVDLCLNKWKNSPTDISHPIAPRSPFMYRVLPRDLQIALEYLSGDSSDLMVLPQKFGKRKSLRILYPFHCFLLKIMSNHFQKMVTFELLRNRNCSKSYWATKEIGAELTNCVMDEERRQSKIERPICSTATYLDDSKYSYIIPERENNDDISIRKFIKSIMDWYVVERDAQSQSQHVRGQSKTREFMEALKSNGIDDLLIHNSKMKVGNLHGKTISFIICDFDFLECIKFQEDDPDIMTVWIPTEWPPYCGHGSCTRFFQRMPWVTFPYPQMVNITIEGKTPRFIVLDKGGQVANQNALGLLLAWGVKLHPFTQHSIRESGFSMESESCLEFLMHGMNIARIIPMKSKMTFLCAERPLTENMLFRPNEMPPKLEQLNQIHANFEQSKVDGNFEVLYVGHLWEAHKWERHFDGNIQTVKQEYKDATQNMCWPSLTFSDMIMFRYRCKYLANEEVYELYKESNIMMKPLHRLANQLYHNSLVLVDNDGPVTSHGYDVLQMICELSDEISKGEYIAMRIGMRMVKDELRKSLSRGRCTPYVKSFFRDEIHNLPQHPHHRILCSTRFGWYTCALCDVQFYRLLDKWNEQRSYQCTECEWNMCESCWMAVHYMNF